MTISHLLSQTDALSPNRFSQSQKIRWISDAEQILYHQIILRHEGAPPSFSGYDDSTPMDTPLLAPAPYDSLYRWYLQSQMDLCNGDMSRYNNSMALFNSALLTFQDAYNRAHLPQSAVTRFRV